MIKSSITDSPRNVSNGELDNFGIDDLEHTDETPPTG